MPFEVEGAVEVANKLREFSRSFPRALKDKGLRRVAAEAKGQTLERLKRTKKDPDGVDWEPWSDAYAATREPRHSLLQDTKAMTRRVKVVRSGADTLMGSDQPYAPFVQEKREFVGVGGGDIADLDAALQAFADEEAQRSGVA